MVAAEVFEQKEFLELKEEHVARIIGSDTLNATEAQVVDAVMRWGRAQVAAQKLDEKVRPRARAELPVPDRCHVQTGCEQLAQGAG